MTRYKIYFKNLLQIFLILCLISYAYLQIQIALFLVLCAQFFFFTNPCSFHKQLRHWVENYISRTLLLSFDVHGSVHRKYIPINIQQDATLHSLFISGNCSTCFGCYFHPSWGAHTTVSTASGICHTVTAICRYSGR